MFKISNSEKIYILEMHKNYALTINKNYELIANDDNKTSEIESLLSEIKKILTFQKTIHLHHLSMLNENEKLVYFKKIQKVNIFGLFKKDSLIIENYKNSYFNLINESKIDYSDKIDYINNFIIEQISYYNYLNPLNFAQNAKNLVKTGVNYVANSVNYLKEKGVDWVFENIRTALFSNVATAIQIAVQVFSSGVGQIANAVVWAMMAIYDGYNAFVNRKSGALMNFCIDMINVVASGVFNKFLKPLTNAVATNMKSVFQYLLKTDLGKNIGPLLRYFDGGKFTTFLDEGAKFMQKKGMSWVGNVLLTIKTQYNAFIVGLKNLTQNTVGKVGAVTTKTIIQGLNNINNILAKFGVNISGIFQPQIFKTLAQKSEQELAKMFGSIITKAELEVISSQIDEYTKNLAIDKALEYIDQKFGSKFGKVYIAYVGASKLYSVNNKLFTGKIGANKKTFTDVVADFFEGKDPLGKPERNYAKVKKGEEVFNNVQNNPKALNTLIPNPDVLSIKGNRG